MTDDRMALKPLIRQASDGQLLAGILGFVAERLMALHPEALCNAGPVRRRRWSAAEKQAIVPESLEEGEIVSGVANHDTRLD